MNEYDDGPEYDDYSEMDDYEVVANCRDIRQAEIFRDLLSDHDIEAVIGDEDQSAAADCDGVAVLVHSDSVDEARDIISELELIEELDDIDPDRDEDPDDEDLEDDLQPLDAYDLDDDDDYAYDEQDELF